MCKIVLYEYSNDYGNVVIGIVIRCRYRSFFDYDTENRNR